MDTIIHVFLTLLILCTCVLPVDARQTETAINPAYNLLTGTLALTKLLIPPLNKDKWTQYNSDLKDLVNPIHQAIANDIVTPSEGGDELLVSVRTYLLGKPEFVKDSKSNGYIQHKSKTVEKARSVKNELRKNAKNAPPNERKEFYQAIRTHNFLLKEQRKRDKSKSAHYQETLYKDDF